MPRAVRVPFMRAGRERAERRRVMRKCVFGAEVGLGLGAGVGLGLGEETA